MRSATRTASIGSRMSSSSTTNSSPPNRASVLVAGGVVLGGRQPLTTSSRRTAPASRSANATQQLVAGGVTEAVVDVLEAIEVDEQHGEAVVGMPDAAGHRPLEPLHEQHAVGQLRQGVVNRVVHQPVVGQRAGSRSCR